MTRRLNITVLGLSITSSWGNGHATTYRALLKALAARGHRVLFLERDVEWYASHRDLPNSSFCDVRLYEDVDDLVSRFAGDIATSDCIIIGSYVPDGVEVAERVMEAARGPVAFYDIDTPVTLRKLSDGDHEYLTPELVSRYDLYLSFSGGHALRILEDDYGSPRARALYCSVDVEHYFPEEFEPKFDLGYMGTYSDDRQPPLERLMLEAARQWPQGRFIAAGPQYPESIQWPPNVEHIDHLPPAEHRRFYNEQRFTLNITRADMVRLGFSPSVRLFEAAACGTPIISDYWEGLQTIFEPDEEILISHGPEDTLRYLRDMDEAHARRIGRRARRRVQAHHTSEHRAAELESHLMALLDEPVPEPSKSLAPSD